MDGEFSLYVDTQSMSHSVFFAGQFYSMQQRLVRLSRVSLSSNHLHFCRSTKCLPAVCCIECLCAKSYRGVINPDLSAHVFNFKCPHASRSDSHVSHILQIVVLNSLDFKQVIFAAISRWSEHVPSLILWFVHKGDLVTIKDAGSLLNLVTKKIWFTYYVASIKPHFNLTIIWIYDLSLTGGSLDVYKKIPEHVLGRIAVAVSLHRNCFQTCIHKLSYINAKSSSFLQPRPFSVWKGKYL